MRSLEEKDMLDLDWIILQDLWRETGDLASCDQMSFSMDRKCSFGVLHDAECAVQAVSCSGS